MHRHLIGVVCALTLLATTACVATPARVVQLEAATDLAIGIPQQNVYITKADAPDDQVFRLAPDEATDEVLAQPIFTVASVNPPDMFETSENPRGPFEKGKELGLTMNEWLSVTGQAEYIKHASLDEVQASFQNLRPNSVYTLWCVLATAPPEESAFEIPCGNPDGSDSIYQSDADGNLSIHKIMSPMPYATENSFSTLCLAYHSDGQTYGSVVGDYGRVAHIHTCFDILTEDHELWEMKSIVQPAGM